MFNFSCVEPIHKQGKSTAINIVKIHRLSLAFSKSSTESRFEERGEVTHNFLVYSEGLAIWLSFYEDSNKRLRSTNYLLVKTVYE